MTALSLTIDAVRRMPADQACVAGRDLATVPFPAPKLARPRFPEGVAGLGKAGIARTPAASPGAILKCRADIARLQGSEAKRRLDEVRKELAVQ